MDALSHKTFGDTRSINTGANAIEAGGNTSVARPLPGCRRESADLRGRAEDSCGPEPMPDLRLIRPDSFRAALLLCTRAQR